MKNIKVLQKKKDEILHLKQELHEEIVKAINEIGPKKMKELTGTAASSFIRIKNGHMPKVETLTDIIEKIESGDSDQEKSV